MSIATFLLQPKSSIAANRDHIVYKVQNIYYLDVYKKSLKRIIIFSENIHLRKKKTKRINGKSFQLIGGFSS